MVLLQKYKSNLFHNDSLACDLLIFSKTYFKYECNRKKIYVYMCTLALLLLSLVLLRITYCKHIKYTMDIPYLVVVLHYNIPSVYVSVHVLYSMYVYYIT